MAQTQINGGTQIRSGTITLDRLVSGYSVPTANLVDGANFVKKDGSVTMTASLNHGGFEALNAATPTSSTSLATKAYVDQKAGGIGGIHEVTALASANISLSAPGATIDGVAPVSGTSVILLTGQTTTSQNGPWVWNGASSALTRPTWWTSGAVVSTGQYFLIGPGGTTYGDSKWWMTNTSAVTVDTTAETFVQDSSGATYTAGTGLTLSGGAFSVNYGTTSATAAAGNDSRITGAVQSGGALGTPASGNLSNCSALSAATGLSGALAAANFPALTGDVTTTAGSLATTVNNTAGSGFLKYTNIVIGEIPSGTINGSNTSFGLAHTPSTSNGGNSSLRLHLDGVRLTPGAGNDYTLSGSTITMLWTPQTGDTGFIADYLF